MYIHIGGDISLLKKNIIAIFDTNIKDYFNKEDIEKGYLEVENRKGIIEQFPITAISIGVVKVHPGEYQNPLEIGEVGAQVKHLAKTQMGSAYAINRRNK